MTQILLVEDDREDAEWVAELLRDFPSPTQLTVVHGGDHALDYLLDREAYASNPQPKPGLILLDLNIPGMGGVDLLRILKINPRTANIPVVIVSGAEDPRISKELFAMGILDFLVKPVRTKDIHDLLTRR